MHRDVKRLLFPYIFIDRSWTILYVKKNPTSELSSNMAINICFEEISQKSKV